MKQRMLFSNLLMSILVICTIMYQSLHSLTHVLAELQQTCKSDSNDSHHHIDTEDCQICDFTFSPFTTTELQTFTFYKPNEVFQKYFFSEITFQNSFTQYSFLRGPPAFI